MPEYGARRRPRPAALLAVTAAVAGALVATAHAAPSASAAATADASCPWVGSTAPIDQRVAQVLDRMNLDEKITMVHGVAGSKYTGYIPGNSRLCIPALKLQDGPVGVRMSDTTQLPSAADLAASFDPALARAYGSVIGAEDRTKGVDVDLGPTVNIVRDPRWGRAFESYSEDPYLTAQIGAEDINGIQSEGVMAQVKHWAVYNQETRRNTASDNAVVDDRTVHEIYASAFDRIIDQSHPASAMCSYSSVNGTFACENAYLDTILKDEFGFDGFITSDWGGTHSTVASADAGMDMEMPRGTYFGAALKQAVQDGHVPQSRLDDMVTRILRQEFRFGLFEHPSPDTPTAVASTPGHVKVAEQVAEDGAVLLKNSGHVLPVDTGNVHSIAVIGDGAGPDTMTHGGGSATVAGTGTVTPYDGIRARAGSGTTVAYAQGYLGDGGYPAIDSSYFTPATGSGNGLRAEYFDNTTLSGTPVVTRTDPNVSYTWNGSPAPGVPSTNFSVRWTGTINPPVSGTYTFGLTSDDGSRLFVNGKQVIDNWRNQAAKTETAKVDLTAGTPATIEVDYYQAAGDATVNLGWTRPGEDLISQAANLAKQSDVAIVYANDFESEGSDLANIDLPDEQNKLIDAVAAANPDTVVVLNTGSAVTMPWVDKVKGIVEAWYPGQQSGAAIAALLFGDVNPSGKLPVTFPQSIDQVPANTPAQWPGQNGSVQYSEGLGVGYRWYDAHQVTPLFPFGYGLSYTDFAFSNLHLASPTLSEHGRVEATADVTNTGDRAGAEVAQLYLTDPTSTGEPPNQLEGFQKVFLRPGQTKQVHFSITSREASYWDTRAHGWELAAGTYTVHVGDSSRSLPLSDTFAVTRTTGPEYTSVSAPDTVLPGSTITVTTAFTNAATVPVHNAETTLDVPAGWTAEAQTPTSFALVAPGQTQSTRWSVSVPQDAAGGPASMQASTTYAGSDAQAPSTDSTSLQVAYADLPAAFNTVGVTDDANPKPGNFDGSGYSYSAQALASVGVTPGGAVTSGPATFRWPDVPPGTADVVTTDGQAVAFGGSGSGLALLGAGTNGTQSGPVTVTYTDGTRSQSTVTLADWYSNKAVSGCSLVVTAPRWNRPAGSPYPAAHHVSLYSATLPLDTGKQIAYVTLPTNHRLHVFAMAATS
jgi:beta-glucosidase